MMTTDWHGPSIIASEILIGHAHQALFELLACLGVLFQHHIDIGDHVHDPCGIPPVRDTGPSGADHALSRELVAGGALEFIDILSSEYPVSIIVLFYPMISFVVLHDNSDRVSV